MSEQEQFTEIDKFLEWYKSARPETIYLVKNKERYAEVMDAIRTICLTAIESNPEGTTFTASLDPLLGTSVCVEVTSDTVQFDEIPEFVSALSKASCFEINARDDGKFTLGLTFQKVFDIIDPQP